MWLGRGRRWTTGRCRDPGDSPMPSQRRADLSPHHPPLHQTAPPLRLGSPAKQRSGTSGPAPARGRDERWGEQAAPRGSRGPGERGSRGCGGPQGSGAHLLPRGTARQAEGFSVLVSAGLGRKPPPTAPSPQGRARKRSLTRPCSGRPPRLDCKHLSRAYGSDAGNGNYLFLFFFFFSFMRAKSGQRDKQVACKFASLKDKSSG